MLCMGHVYFSLDGKVLDCLQDVLGSLCRHQCSPDTVCAMLSGFAAGLATEVGP